MKARRKFTPEYKAKLVLEMVSGQRNPSEIARKEGIKDGLLYEWRAEFMRNAPMIFSEPNGDSKQSQQEDKIAELEQVIGRLTIENEVLKKASRWLSGISKPSER
jgi:transposase-like protein